MIVVGKHKNKLFKIFIREKIEERSLDLKNESDTENADDIANALTKVQKQMLRWL